MIRFPTPTVLECMHFVSDDICEHRRIVKNYEFDLYLGGNREIVLDGNSYTVETGCLIFRRPGQLTIGKGNYNMYLLTLDFCHKNASDSKLFRSISGTCQPLADFQELDVLPPVFKPLHFEELKQLFEHLSHCSYPGVTDLERQQEYIKEFLLLVLYDAYAYRRRNRSLPPNETTIAKQTHNYILEHFHEPIHIRDMASTFYLNENYLIRLFKKQYGVTPHQYLLETRLTQARYLLLYSNRSVKEVALSCGFNTPSYFIKKFHHRFQKTPLSFRQALLNRENDLKETNNQGDSPYY